MTVSTCYCASPFESSHHLLTYYIRLSAYSSLKTSWYCLIQAKATFDLGGGLLPIVVLLDIWAIS